MEQTKADLDILRDAIKNSSATLEEKLAIFNALQNFLLHL